MLYLGYNEIKQRGTPYFPLEIHHIDSSHPQYSMPLHWHIDYEIIRILEGEFIVSLDEYEYISRKGDVIFIPSGILHAGIPKACVYECIVFEFNMLMKENSICDSYLSKLFEQNIIVTNYFPQTIHSICHVIWNLFETLWNKKEGYELISIGLLIQFIGIIYSEHHYVMNTKKTSSNHRKILQLKKALTYIETNYNQPLSLEKLSRSIGMSPKYFCRFFREMTHKTPIDYLNYYRIEYACGQLTTTELSITEVAFCCGFNDLSYFIKTFKRYKGVTPKKYISIFQSTLLHRE